MEKRLKVAERHARVADASSVPEECLVSLTRFMNGHDTPGGARRQPQARRNGRVEQIATIDWQLMLASHAIDLENLADQIAKCAHALDRLADVIGEPTANPRVKKNKP